MQGGDLFEQCVTRPAVFDHIVGGGEALGARRLRREDGARLPLAQAALAHAGELLLLGAIDHQHPVDAPPVVGGFDQQGTTWTT